MLLCNIEMELYRKRRIDNDRLKCRLLLTMRIDRDGEIIFFRSTDEKDISRAWGDFTSDFLYKDGSREIIFYIVLSRAMLKISLGYFRVKLFQVKYIH